MREEQDYIRDIKEMRTIMERSSKFMSLSGLASILAGIYALLGGYLAWGVFDFQTTTLQSEPPGLNNVIFVAIAVLVMAVATAFLLSGKKASKRGERLWNATSRRLLFTTAVPLVTGGLLMLIFVYRSLAGLMIPCSLIFYGLALYNAGRLTYQEVKSLGIIQIVLGLFSVLLVNYALLFWVLGFGVAHIIYGIYLHNKYER
jgi:hypothetical protein